MIWLEFTVSIIIIFYCGRKLSYYGDVISKKTGMGGGFIGVILLGAVTSLPELITTISSVSFVKQVNLAWGNILGSNLLNLAVLSFCDIFIKKNQEIRIFDRGNVLTGNFSVIITLISLVALITGKDFIFFHTFSVYTVLILTVYVTGSFVLYRTAVSEKEEMLIEKTEADISNAKLYVVFALNAFLIIAAGISVTYACDEIAKITGLGATFVGTLFLAIATSLPEIVVSVSAVKMGAISMAGGNILGSNFFNISILGFSDFFYRAGSGSLYLDASKINLFTGIIFVIVTNIVLTGMVLRSDKRFLKFGFDSILVMTLYILTFYYIYEAI